MLVIPRWQYIFISIILAIGFLLALPNFLPTDLREKLPKFMPRKTVSLGLDLQGGSYLLYEVDLKTVQKEELQKKLRDIRVGLKEAGIRTKSMGFEKDSIVIKPMNIEDVDRTVKVLKEISRPKQLGLNNKHYEVRRSEENGSITLKMTSALLRNLQDRILSQSIETIRRRLGQFGATEPTLQRLGRNRVLVQVPGVKNPERLKAIIGKTARMTFHLVEENASPEAIEKARAGHPPSGTFFAPSDSPGEAGLLLKKRTLLSGDNLVSASQVFDPNSGEPIVSFRFDSVGGAKFGKITSANIGKRFAIVLDKGIITAPVIRQAIVGGGGQISGNFTVESAKDLSILLNAGALPADLIVVEERTVGAELGADSIRSGKLASFVGFAAVFVFILLVYGISFGFFANISLLANLFLIVGALSILPVTLTLPGIAGVILTIGMAVDANVLIYERIREEIRSGRSPIIAIDTGYRRALSPILDANVTTLIAAIVLMAFGSGPVRGFAYTLAVGVVTSVFTAFWVSRLLVASWVRSTRPKQLPI